MNKIIHCHAMSNNRSAELVWMGAKLAAILAATGLTACAGMSDRDRNTAAGAAIGGVAGSVLSGGSAAGTVGGAAVGGVIGNQVDSKGK